MKSIVVSFVLLLISCFPQNPKSPCEAALNQEFDIKVGHEVLIKGEPLKLKFISVLEDSRCPTGVQCIHAGNGKIELVVKLSKDEKRLELNTAMGPQETIVDSYEIKLVNLSPYPKGDRQIKTDDYVAKIVVHRVSS